MGMGMGGMNMGNLGMGISTPLPNMMNTPGSAPPTNMVDGMSMQRPGTSMGSITATSLGGSMSGGGGFANQFGGMSSGNMMSSQPQPTPAVSHGPQPGMMNQQQQQQQHFSMMLQMAGMTREQFASLNQHDKQIMMERMSMKIKERQRQQELQMMAQMGGMMSQQPQQQPQPQPQQQFPGAGFGNDRPSSTTSHGPTMMPPPPPGVRPGTAMGMRRAPSVDQVRPPSRIGDMMNPSMFPKALPDQQPGNAYPQHGHTSPVGARVAGSPRIDSTGPNMFPPAGTTSGGYPIGSSGNVSPTRPMSASPNSVGFVSNGAMKGTPALNRVNAVPQTPTTPRIATPSNMNVLVTPQPLAPTQQPIQQPPAPTPMPSGPSSMPIPVAPNASTSTRAPTPAPTAPTTTATTSPSAVASADPTPAIAKLPPLPPTNPTVTEVTTVPLKDSLKLIPELSETEINDVKDWMKLDKEYENVYEEMRKRMAAEREALGKRWWERGGGINVGLGAVIPAWGNRGRGFDVRYPNSRPRRDGRRGKVAKREGLKLPRKIDARYANLPEQLVPIRLEFDVEQHHKMRDTFVWNLNDPVITPENFAQSVVEDYNLSSSYHSVIVKSIQDQLSDFKAHSTNYDGEGGDYVADVALAAPEKGLLDEESSLWWRKWRKRVRKDYTVNGAEKARKRRKVVEDEQLMSVEDFHMDENETHEDMRVVIKLDIIVGAMKLDDQFEWDIENPHASPESFADIYVQELGLGGEFRTAIAHSIREQVQAYQKSLFLVGHPSDGTPIQDDELRLSFLPGLSSGARALDQVQSFTPMLNYLSDGEIERHEKERDKDMNKRRKRNTRGRRGVALPDREPIRTYRTPAIGFPELDPAILALQVAANAPTSRRAAAAAASLTIANMVASENGTPLLPQTLPTAPQQPQPAAPKEKKPKGHFKAPPLPPSVLRPRAKLTSVPPSTAADGASSTLDGDAAHSMNTLPKVVTAKRAKELEREAKEKEFADGQHANFIDGVWHCSNCGCPESIAIGRRKGPLGDKSQCGTCGKFWHRHRRPRPVEYNTDPDFHSNVKRDSELARTIGKKKGGAAALRAQSGTVPTTPASEPQSPRTKPDEESAPRLSPVPPPSKAETALSPVSTTSSASEAPLAQRAKANGTSNSHTPSVAPASSAPPPAPASTSPPPPDAPTSVQESSAPPPSQSGPPGPPSQRSWPPQWLATCMQGIQYRFPSDKFEVALRKVTANSDPEWRIKCLDCPGKLYKPGPGETLSNFEVHLRNNTHRRVVEKRVAAASSGS
ncbi:SNF5-domain-containing protein [Guyanagaster necrorhizus]|uniref:SNF5-domain-containing protein n=1 Tax=Guyanagaster necrorhizus TaxID=856835 RepID=A0A9P7W334_9AGAR|nr:SNF5-domain-containing protein [Guyanagaster necrorhizus MCA 3950]KAG7451525.1 SNF5-domain-containing protein [Guyanagaster necrorhizus MCA 3950]